VCIYMECDSADPTSVRCSSDQCYQHRGWSLVHHVARGLRARAVGCARLEQRDLWRRGHSRRHYRTRAAPLHDAEHPLGRRDYRCLDHGLAVDLRLFGRLGPTAQYGGGRGRPDLRGPTLRAGEIVAPKPESILESNRGRSMAPTLHAMISKTPIARRRTTLIAPRTTLRKIRSSYIRTV